MYRLTQKRLEEARPILEKYREELYRNYRFEASLFELELRKCWNLGYQELKSIAIQMLKNARYRYIAIYYMEHINAPVVVTEFQIPLAKAYGIKSYYGPDMQEKRDALWANFRSA